MDVSWIAALIGLAGVVILGLAIRGLWRSARNERTGGETIPAAMVVVDDHAHDEHAHHGHDPGGHGGGHPG
jgi:hypothetical protein